MGSDSHNQGKHRINKYINFVMANKKKWKKYAS